MKEYKFKSGDKVKLLGQPFNRHVHIPEHHVYFIAWLEKDHCYAIMDEYREVVYYDVPEECLRGG